MSTSKLAVYDLLPAEPLVIVTIVVGSSISSLVHPRNVKPSLLGLFNVNVSVSTLYVVGINYSISIRCITYFYK